MGRFSISITNTDNPSQSNVFSIHRTANMQLHSLLALGAFTTLVSASLDSVACNGAGSCLSTADCIYLEGYDCGAEGTIDATTFAKAEELVTYGLGEIGVNVELAGCSRRLSYL